MDDHKQNLVKVIADKNAKLKHANTQKNPRKILRFSINKQLGESAPNLIPEPGEGLVDKNKWLEDLHPGFSSLNVQKGNLPKKKDDLISIFHIMIYCLKGILPWYDSSEAIKEEIRGECRPN